MNLVLAPLDWRGLLRGGRGPGEFLRSRMCELDLCKTIELARAILARHDFAQLVRVAGKRRLRMGPGHQDARAAHAAQFRLFSWRIAERSSSTGCSEASLLVMSMAMTRSCLSARGRQPAASPPVRSDAGPGTGC